MSYEGFANSNGDDWDSNFKNIPSSKEGEFSQPGTNAQVADLNRLTSTETARTPFDGNETRSEGRFPTKNSTKRS